MGIKLFEEPKLEKPDMIASWPGIGNIGVMAVDTLRAQFQARELGEIEPFDFFYPNKVIIKAGILEDLVFPSSKFYYVRLGEKDLIFFIGEEQPSNGEGMYAQGKKAYQMASLVLDVAARFDCRRIYTSGAAVALIHHASQPRVWITTSSKDLIKEMKNHKNIISMGEIEGTSNRGNISGLNGLLLGLAKKRGFEAICLMGEIPDYLSRAPFPYPRASKSVLEALANLLGTEVDYTAIDEMVVQIDNIIAGIYGELPAEIRERIEQRKAITQAKPEIITEEDEKWIKEHIDELFKKKGGSEDERAS